jgi:hypothetical protein
VNKKAEFKLFGEYNGKPPVSEEIKPGEPEWKFDSAECDPNSNNDTIPVPKPDSWTKGATISGTLSFRPKAVGEWRLTYKASVRFPKLKRSDGSPDKDAQGNPTYFPADSATVTVSLKATDAKFKVWIESIDDNFPGHSQFKLGIMEKGEIKIGKISTTDPTLTFSRSVPEDNYNPALFTLNNQSVEAHKISGTATIKVWAKDSSGEEYGPENLIVSVMKPSGVGMELGSYDELVMPGVGTLKYAKVRHTKGKAGVGIIGLIYLLPSDVSFCNLYAAEGSDSNDDGKVTVSGFFKLWNEDIKKDCDPYWKILENPNSTQQQKNDATNGLISVENRVSQNIHCVQKARFFYHKEAPGNFSLLKKINVYSKKPNTLKVLDIADTRDRDEKSYGISTPTGFIDGTLVWNISCSYWTDKNDNTTKVQDFSHIDQIFIIEQDGKATVIKGNATGYATLNYKNSTFEPPILIE